MLHSFPYSSIITTSAFPKAIKIEVDALYSPKSPLQKESRSRTSSFLSFFRSTKSQSSQTQNPSPTISLHRNRVASSLSENPTLTLASSSSFTGDLQQFTFKTLRGQEIVGLMQSYRNISRERLNSAMSKSHSFRSYESILEDADESWVDTRRESGSAASQKTSGTPHAVKKTKDTKDAGNLGRRRASRYVVSRSAEL